MNLIQRILSVKKKQNISRVLSVENAGVENIMSFFKSLGIDVHDFPFSKCDSEFCPFDSYSTRFNNVNMFNISSKDRTRTIVMGDYTVKAKASYQDDGGCWLPGKPMRYSFRIENGKLEIWRQKR